MFCNAAEDWEDFIWPEDNSKRSSAVLALLDPCTVSKIPLASIFCSMVRSHCHTCLHYVTDMQMIPASTFNQPCISQAPWSVAVRGLPIVPLAVGCSVWQTLFISSSISLARRSLPRHLQYHLTNLITGSSQVSSGSSRASPSWDTARGILSCRQAKPVTNLQMSCLEHLFITFDHARVSNFKDQIFQIQELARST